MKFSDSLNFTALDIETTGLSERKDEIIQIAAVRFRRGKVVEVFDSFVKPTIALPKFIMFLTHIQPEDVKDAPDVAEVLAKLKKFLGSDTLVGHNVSFDLGFINYNYGKIGDFPLENTAWDTVELSRTYLPFGANHKLGTMVKQMPKLPENC